MELLYVLREWLFGEGEELKTFTLDQLRDMRATLDMEPEEFTEFLTGYNCDSYADKSVEVMEALYTGDPEETFRLCMEDHDFLTCYTVYRLWNDHHTPETALSNWRESSLGMIEDIG